jgi:hypothetical protein
VIRLASPLASGQLVFLTNEKTKKEVVCQVVKSKNYRTVTGYVELEFTEPAPGFWGMRFPSAPAVPALAQHSAPRPPAPVAASPSASAPSVQAPAAPMKPAARGSCCRQAAGSGTDCAEASGHAGSSGCSAAARGHRFARSAESSRAASCQFAAERPGHEHAHRACSSLDSSFSRAAGD